MHSVFSKAFDDALKGSGQNAVRPIVITPDTTIDNALKAATFGSDFSFRGYECSAKIVDYYDGDTVHVAFVPFWSIGPTPTIIQYKIRMAGYDSPELKPRLNNPNRLEEKKAAVEAKDALKEKVGADGIVHLVCGDFDKYGRILGTLYSRRGENINEWMINNGYGRPYEGGHKEDYSAPKFEQS